MLKNHIYREVVGFVGHDNNKVLQDNNIWISELQPAFVQVIPASLWNVWC